MIRIKSLFLAANPIDTERLSLDREVREISAKIRASEYRDSIELISVWAVRPDDLIQSLNEYKPQIVHFSGHGSSIGEIVLVDELGNVKAISPNALKTLFATLKDNISVVILNACYSKIQAEAITGIIDCTIGMSTAITDDAAITFIASFYRALGFGRSVQESFNQGTTAMLLAGLAEENIPELLVKPGVDASKIILINGKKADENIESKKTDETSTKPSSQSAEPQGPSNGVTKGTEVAHLVKSFKKDKKPFLKTLLGILIGFAVAVGGILVVSNQLGLFTPSISSSPTPTFTSLPIPTDTVSSVIAPTEVAVAEGVDQSTLTSTPQLTVEVSQNSSSQNALEATATSTPQVETPETRSAETTVAVERSTRPTQTSAVPAPEPTTSPTIDPDLLVVSVSVDSKLAQEAYDDYSFEGYTNTPILFSIERSDGELCYNVYLLNSKTEQLKSWGTYCDGKQILDFTPPANGKYTVRVQGTNRFGAYVLRMDWADSEPELRNQEPTLEPFTIYTGTIATEAYDNYTYIAYNNTPMLFFIERIEGDLCYNVYVRNEKDEELKRWGTYCDGPQSFPYTPQKTETLFVRILATNNYGTYSLGMKWLDTEPGNPNPKPTLSANTIYTSSLAVDAYDDYILDGIANVPVLFMLTRIDGDLCYDAIVYNSENQQVKSWGTYCDGQQTLDFTPQQTEAFIIRIFGRNNHGIYTFQFDNLE